MSMPSSGRSRLLVGLDFGTTFSGISYTIEKPDSPNIEITTLEWADGTKKLPKCPTQILLPMKSTDRTLSSDEDVYALAQGSSLHLCEWFKLSLTDKIDLPEPLRRSKKLRETTQIREDLGYTSYEVTLTFLENLWRRFLQEASNDPMIDDIKSFDIDLTMAIPLFWGKSCKEQLEQIVKELEKSTSTSISVSFISEPEAAARELLRFESRSLNLKGGDAIIVCDCGGGTIDSVAYKIGTNSNNTIEEMLLKTSEIGGAVTQDETFSAKLKDKIAKTMAASDFEALTTADFLPLMNEYWYNGLRKEFMGDNTAITISLPSNWFRPRSDTRTITFSSKDIDEVFQPTMTVVRVILDQIQAVTEAIGHNPKCVLIAGGFGRNPYLCSEVDYAVSDLHRGIRVVAYKNERGWASVSRGAAQSKATMTTIALKFDANYFLLPEGGTSLRRLGKKGDESGDSWIESRELEVSTNEQTEVQKFSTSIYRRSGSGNPSKVIVKVVWPFYGNRTPEDFTVNIKIHHEGSTLAVTFLDHNHSKPVRIPLRKNIPIPNPGPIVFHAV